MFDYTLEKKKTQADWRGHGESQQVDLALEQNERMGTKKMKEVESGGDSCWRRQVGWVPPVAAETQQRPAWSVADETWPCPNLPLPGK